jgi:putative tryptophan/tyrosine transport system substrate-binding protein
LPVAAQASAIPVVGYLSSGSPSNSNVIAFRQGLNESGYVEGLNVIVEYRWAEGQHDRLPQRSASYGTPSTVAAKAATTTIPTVFVVGVDPVKVGLVASLTP